eukprot:6205475-Pleurochrysis_carterae.AAC.1
MRTLESNGCNDLKRVIACYSACASRQMASSSLKAGRLTALAVRGDGCDGCTCALRAERVACASFE